MVVEQLEKGIASGRIKESLKIEFGIRQDTAEQLYVVGEELYRNKHSYSKQEVKQFLVARQMEIARSADSTSSAVNTAAKTLVQILGLSKDEGAEDFSRVRRLWKDLIDASTIEEMNNMVKAMRTEAFDITAISEDAIESRRKTNGFATAATQKAKAAVMVSTIDDGEGDESSAELEVSE